MPKSREDALRLVREFHERLATLYGDRLKGVYLYGSYARGEPEEGSDIDVAVVLAGPVNRRAESRRTSRLIADLSLRENCELMPFFLSDQEHRTTPYSIFRSIDREGVPV